MRNLFLILAVLMATPAMSATAEPVQTASAYARVVRMRSVEVLGSKVTLVDTERLEDGKLVACQQYIGAVAKIPAKDGGETTSIQIESICQTGK